MSETTSIESSSISVETQIQEKAAYKEFFKELNDKFSKNQSNILVSGDYQTIHLKSVEGKLFYLKRPIPNSETKGEIGLILEEPKLGYDYNTIDYQVLDDGMVTKESYSRRSKTETKPTRPEEYEDSQMKFDREGDSQMKFDREGDSQMKFDREGDSQMRYDREMNKRMEEIPPHPISTFEANELTKMINQSSVNSFKKKKLDFII